MRKPGTADPVAIYLYFWINSLREYFSSVKEVLTSTCTQELTEKFNSKRKAKFSVRESKNLNQYSSSSFVLFCYVFDLFVCLFVLHHLGEINNISDL